MNRSQIEALLNDVQSNRTSVPDALERLKDLPFEDLGFAKLDHHRSLRARHRASAGRRHDDPRPRIPHTGRYPQWVEPLARELVP